MTVTVITQAPPPIVVMPPAVRGAITVTLPDGTVLPVAGGTQRPPIVVQPAAAAPAAVTVEVRGLTGEKGEPGDSAAPVIQVAGAPLLRGAPLYVSRASRLAFPARADAYPSAFVAGLADSDTETGFPVGLMRGPFALDDWTPLTGVVGLLPGQVYFLAPQGGLTTGPPSRPDSVASTRVGIALTPRVLDVDPAPPILL